MTGNEILAETVQNKTAKSRIEITGISEKSEQVLDSFEIARFWSRVEVRKQDQCWPWRWGSSKDGYGEFRFSDGSRSTAPRVAYRIENGSLDSDLVIRHRCDNPPCCNPSHLVKGTHADNVADRVNRDRSARGEANARSKLKEFQVRAIRLSPLSDEYFARRFDVAIETVRDARDRKTWTHI